MTFGIDPAFFLSFALVLTLRMEKRLFGLLLPALAHEASHILAVTLAGGRVTRLELSAFGIVLIPSGDLSYPKEIIAVAAGPAAHLLAAGLLCLRDPEAGLAGILLALYNLLPLAGLDGGRIVLLAAESRGKGETGDRLIRIFSLLAFSAGFALTLAAAGCGYPFWGLFLASAAPVLRLIGKRKPLFRRKAALYRGSPEAGASGRPDCAETASRLRARAKE